MASPVDMTTINLRFSPDGVSFTFNFWQKQPCLESNCDGILSDILYPSGKVRYECNKCDFKFSLPDMGD